MGGAGREVKEPVTTHLGGRCSRSTLRMRGSGIYLLLIHHLLMHLLIHHLLIHHLLVHHLLVHLADPGC